MQKPGQSVELLSCHQVVKAADVAQQYILSQPMIGGTYLYNVLPQLHSKMALLAGVVIPLARQFEVCSEVSVTREHLQY